MHPSSALDTRSTSLMSTAPSLSVVFCLPLADAFFFASGPACSDSLVKSQPWLAHCG